VLGVEVEALDPAPGAQGTVVVETTVCVVDVVELVVEVLWVDPLELSPVIEISLDGMVEVVEVVVEPFPASE
jgi:hypothetical protein